MKSLDHTSVLCWDQYLRKGSVNIHAKQKQKNPRRTDPCLAVCVFANVETHSGAPKNARSFQLIGLNEILGVLADA